MSLPMDKPRYSRGRLNMSPEKSLAPDMVGQEHHRSNTSPSQKTAMPRWRGKGREKSTVELACTWIVDHQISAYCLESCPRAQGIDFPQALLSIFSPSCFSATVPSPVSAIIARSSSAYPTTTERQGRTRWAGTTFSSSYIGSLCSRECAVQ